MKRVRYREAKPQKKKPLTRADSKKSTPKKTVKKRSRTSQPIERQLVPTTTSPLITQFDIIIPGNPALCHTYTPWVQGKKVIGNNQHLSNSLCFAIRLQASRPSQYYIFAENADRHLVQLIPGTCNHLGITFNALSQNKTITIPASNSRTPIIDMKNSNYRTIYTVVTDNAYADTKMTELGKQVPSICQKDKNRQMVNNTGFENMLNLIRRNAENHLEWQKKAIR